MSANPSKGKDGQEGRSRGASSSATGSGSGKDNGARSTMTDSGASTRTDLPAAKDSAATKPKKDETTQSISRPASKAKAAPSNGPASPSATSTPPPPPAPSSSPAPPGPVMTAAAPPVGAKRPLVERAKEKSTGSGSGKPPRKAHLTVSRFEPWSVMKFSFVMSLVCFVVLFVAVVVLYVVLSTLGVFDSITDALNDVANGDDKKGSFDPAAWFSASRIFGYTALVGALNVLLITALATVWSVIYNMAADLVGGVEVTLKESE